MKKKISILVLFVLATAMLLASCKAGVPAYNIELDPATGKGTAKFTVAVPKNDVPETGNNFDKEGEQGYIKSPQALLDLFKSKAPAGFTVAMTDEAKMVDVDGDQKDQGNFVYSISFSFTGIEDYNAKLLKLVGQKSFDAVKAREGEEIKKATLTYTKKGDKYEAAFTEDVRTIDVVSEWAVQVMLDDTTGVFRKGLMGNDPGSVAEFSNMINLDGAKCVYKIKYAGEEEEFARISNGEAITMKATVDAIPDGNTAPTSPTAPQTGEKETVAKIVIPIAVAVALLALIAGFVSRSKSNKNAEI